MIDNVKQMAKTPILTLKHNATIGLKCTRLQNLGSAVSPHFRGNVLTEELVWHTSHKMQVHVNILLAA